MELNGNDSEIIPEMFLQFCAKDQKKIQCFKVAFRRFLNLQFYYPHNFADLNCTRLDLSAFLPRLNEFRYNPEITPAPRRLPMLKH